MQDTDDRFDPTELRPVHYADCDDCGHPHREDDLCRNCGTLGRIVEQTASLQMRAKLSLSLLKQTANEHYLREANRLAHWSRIWITAGQMLEGLVPRRARRFICERCNVHQKEFGYEWCARCVRQHSDDREARQEAWREGGSGRRLW